MGERFIIPLAMGEVFAEGVVGVMRPPIVGVNIGAFRGVVNGVPCRDGSGLMMRNWAFGSGSMKGLFVSLMMG